MDVVRNICYVLMLAMSTNVAAAAEIDDDPALVAIDAAIQSLKQRPSQFTMEVSCIGAQAISNGGGTGQSVTVTGGAAGSQTTGMVVSMNGAQCTAALSNAINGLNHQAIQQLAELKELLQAPTTDKSSIMSKLSELGKTYVMPALQSVLEALIKKKLRL